MAVTGTNNIIMGFSSYKGQQPQTGRTKQNLAQNFASKGFTMPGGIVDKPSQDAYMKGKLQTLGGYSTQDEARMASARAAKASYEARNLPVPQQVLDILAGNYGKDHAGETMTAPALNPQGQPWSKPQGYAPSYQNQRLAAAQDVLTGQPNGGAPAWAREAAGGAAPTNAPAPFSAQPPGVTATPAPSTPPPGADPQRFAADPQYRAAVQQELQLAQQTTQKVSSIFDQIKATPGVDNFRAGVKSAFESLMQPQSILMRLRGQV